MKPPVTPDTQASSYQSIRTILKSTNTYLLLFSKHGIGKEDEYMVMETKALP